MGHLENSPRRRLVERASREAQARRVDPGLQDWQRRAEIKEAFEVEQMLKQTMPSFDDSDPRD